MAAFEPRLLSTVEFVAMTVQALKHWMDIPWFKQGVVPKRVKKGSDSM